MKTCKCCHKEFNSYDEESICFQCTFWLNVYQQDKHRSFAIIDGVHYVLRPSIIPKHVAGMCGRPYYIKFLSDNHIQYCNNLWHQGKIPDLFKELFPNNAIFVSQEEYEEQIKLKQNV